MTKDIERFQISNFNIHMSLLLKSFFKNSNAESYLEQVVKINNILESLRFIGISEQGFIYAAQIWFSDVEADRDLVYFESFLFSFVLNAVANSLAQLPSYSSVEPEMQVLAYIEDFYVPQETINDFISFISDLSISEAVSSSLLGLLGGLKQEGEECFFGLEK